MSKIEYLTEYDGIVKPMQMYIDGSRQGKLNWNGEWRITHKLFHWHDQ